MWKRSKRCDQRRCLAFLMMMATLSSTILASSVAVERPDRALEMPAQRWRGVPRVVDGDTLVLATVKIRLHGIDAPEKNQSCYHEDRQAWACGMQATSKLSALIGKKEITCEEKGHDRYGRFVAVCFKDNENINLWMVANGWAVAYRRYSQDYVPAEEAARFARYGIWSGTFEAPEEWRRR